MLTIAGKGFGTGPGVNLLMLVLDGSKNSYALAIRRWADREIQTFFPNDPRIQIGDRFKYFVGIKDRRGNWLSNTDKTFTICQ